jgi:hypothetical protein
LGWVLPKLDRINAAGRQIEVGSFGKVLRVEVFVMQREESIESSAEAMQWKLGKVHLVCGRACRLLGDE